MINPFKFVFKTISDSCSEFCLVSVFQFEFVAILTAKKKKKPVNFFDIFRTFASKSNIFFFQFLRKVDCKHFKYNKKCFPFSFKSEKEKNPISKNYFARKTIFQNFDFRRPQKCKRGYYYFCGCFVDQSETIKKTVEAFCRNNFLSNLSHFSKSIIL
jgi:hypothetical protein